MIIPKNEFPNYVEKQRELDAKIYEKQELKLLSLERIDSAYRVEVAETVNELKGDFKYWSNKSPEWHKFLEEYIDATHFMLSYVYHFADKFSKRLNYVEGENRIEHMFRKIEKLFGNLENTRVMVIDQNEFTLLTESMENYSLKLPFELEAWELATLAIKTDSLLESFFYLTELAKRLGITADHVRTVYENKLTENHRRSDSGVY